MRKVKFACVLFAAAFVFVSGQAFAKGGGHTETAGNNLSLPVIWAEGKLLDLRGNPADPPTLLGPYTEVDGVKWYHQQEDLNFWQAESADWSSGPVHVSKIDWGDNLEARAWTIRSIVRTEVVLYQDLATTMRGYEMNYLFGEGLEEVWGTNGVAYDSSTATVYSGVARYTIQKLKVAPYDESGQPIENETLGLAWDHAAREWAGQAGPSLYNSAVWDAEGIDGKELSAIYSAEINVPGKVIYGWNWNIKRLNEGVGYYRITFSLDPVGGKEVQFNCNTFFTEGITQVMLTENVVGGGVAVIDYANNLTYIDVLVEDR